MGTITVMLILIIGLTSAFAFNQKNIMAQLQFNAYQIIHRHQYYRMLTHAFIHANWEHLIVNMIVLFSFGTLVERYFQMYFGTIGTTYYLILFFGSVIFLVFFLANFPYGFYYIRTIVISTLASAF